MQDTSAIALITLSGPTHRTLSSASCANRETVMRRRCQAVIRCSSAVL